MPYGLCNAPAVFQYLIHKVLGSLRFTTVLAYLDDILIPSKTVESGLDALRQVFDRVRAAKLTLRFAKCSFLRRKVDYLRHEASSEGIRPGARKIAAVDNGASCSVISRSDRLFSQERESLRPFSSTSDPSAEKGCWV